MDKESLKTELIYCIERYLDKNDVVWDIINSITSEKEERAYLQSLTVSVDLIGEPK